jgi:polysaccharide pyruvyl transferase WcaK-like protein
MNNYYGTGSAPIKRRCFVKCLYAAFATAERKVTIYIIQVRDNVSWDYLTSRK